LAALANTIFLYFSHSVAQCFYDRNKTNYYGGVFVVGGEKIKKIAYVYVCRMGWGVAGGEVQRKHLQTSCRKKPVPTACLKHT